MTETEQRMKLIIPASTVVYEMPVKIIQKVRYSAPQEELDCSPSLTHTGRNFYGTVEWMAQNSYDDMSSARDELAIQLDCEKIGIDSRQAEAFNDLFGRNDDKRYIWQWTKTFLRTPQGWEGGRYETDSKGNKKYPRIAMKTDVRKAIRMLKEGAGWKDIGDSLNYEIGEAMVPEGGGRVIPNGDAEEVWHIPFGIPRITSAGEKDMKIENHTTHFYFNNNPPEDEITGRPDVAVGRWRGWLHVVDGRCLGVDADYRRWDAGSNDGFRLVVRGPEHEVQREVIGETGAGTGTGYSPVI